MKDAKVAKNLREVLQAVKLAANGTLRPPALNGR